MSAPPHEAKARICAYCGKPQNEHFRPFCSKRCADLDLGKWLNGEYAIPGNEQPQTSLGGPEEDDG